MMLALVLVAGFIAFEFLGHAFHRLLHSKWSGALHRAHMTHHLKLYPPSDFLSAKYRNAGADSTTYRFAAVAAVVAVGIALLFPLHYSLPLVAELAVIGLANSYVHDSVHIRGHWMERFAVYQRWRDLHWMHHVDMGTNFGIFTFLADRALGSYVPSWR